MGASYELQTLELSEVGGVTKHVHKQQLGHISVPELILLLQWQTETVNKCEQKKAFCNQRNVSPLLLAKVREFGSFFFNATSPIREKWEKRSRGRLTSLIAVRIMADSRLITERSSEAVLHARTCVTIKVYERVCERVLCVSFTVREEREKITDPRPPRLCYPATFIERTIYDALISLDFHDCTKN